MTVQNHTNESVRPKLSSNRFELRHDVAFKAIVPVSDMAQTSSTVEGTAYTIVSLMITSLCYHEFQSLS